MACYPSGYMAVQFEEQEFNQPNQMRQGGQGAVTSLILKLGLAKTVAQANIVMLIIAVIAIGLTIFFIWPDSTPTSVPPSVGTVPAQGT